MPVVIFALTILLFGFINLIIAFELLGKPQGGQKLVLRILHRIIGYAFVIFFLLLFTGMCGRFGYQGTFSPKAAIHIVLALFTVVLLAYKILTARRYKKFASHLFALGAFLFAICFAMITFVAIPAIMTDGFESHAETKAAPAQVDAETPECFSKEMKTAEVLLVDKCTHCHSLGQAIYGIHEYETPEDWANLVAKMSAKKAGLISEDQAAAIAKYMTSLVAN